MLFSWFVKHLKGSRRRLSLFMSPKWKVFILSFWLCCCVGYTKTTDAVGFDDDENAYVFFSPSSSSHTECFQLCIRICMSYGCAAVSMFAHNQKWPLRFSESMTFGLQNWKQQADKFMGVQRVSILCHFDSSFQFDLIPFVYTTHGISSFRETKHPYTMDFIFQPFDPHG